MNMSSGAGMLRNNWCKVFSSSFCKGRNLHIEPSLSRTSLGYFWSSSSIAIVNSAIATAATCPNESPAQAAKAAGSSKAAAAPGMNGARVCDPQKRGLEQYLGTSPQIPEMKTAFASLFISF